MTEIPDSVKVIMSLAMFAALVFLIYCVMTGNDGELKTMIAGILTGIFAVLGLGNIFINHKSDVEAVPKT